MKNIFAGPNGLRAGWRLLLFIGLIQLITYPAQALLTKLGAKEHALWHPMDFVIGEGVEFPSAILAAAIMRIIERRRWSFRDYGFGLQRGLPLFLQGCVWGLLAPALLIALIYFAGGITFHGLAIHGRELLTFAAFWLIAMILLGCNEEFLFRGYPLFTLSTGMGFWPASILSSVIFAALHYFLKPMETVFDALSVGLIGLFLCLTLQRTKSLWFAIGFHAMFDYAALIVFAAPNTGNKGQSAMGHLLDVSYHGPAWLTGGPVGIEASVFVFIVIAAMFFFFDRTYRNRQGVSEQW